MPSTNDNGTLELARYGRLALITGGAAAVLAVIGAVLNVGLFMHAYLTAYFFWLAIALGSLAVLMIQNLAGGLWGAVLRRPLEAAAGTLPLLALLFVPVLIGLPNLYVWTQPGWVGNVAVPQVKEFYLSVPFFIGRAIIYFAVWIVLAWELLRWSRRRDQDPDPALTVRMRNLSAPGLVLITLTVTFAAFDWLMSLSPNWASSIWGAVVATDALLTGFAFATLLATLWAEREPFAELTSPYFFNTLGSLMLAFLMLWAYMSVSQLILIYAGNLPDEQVWYAQRIQGGWVVTSWFVALFHFIVPFGFLVIRSAKRNRHVLGAICALLLLAGYVNLYWFVQPNFPSDSPVVILYELVLAVAIGGLWLALFARQLGRWPLLAPTDPKLVAHLEIAREQ